MRSAILCSTGCVGSRYFALAVLCATPSPQQASTVRAATILLIDTPQVLRRLVLDLHRQVVAHLYGPTVFSLLSGQKLYLSANWTSRDGTDVDVTAQHDEDVTVAPGALKLLVFGRLKNSARNESTDSPTIS